MLTGGKPGASGKMGGTLRVYKANTRQPLHKGESSLPRSPVRPSTTAELLELKSEFRISNHSNTENAVLSGMKLGIAPQIHVLA